MDKKDVDAEMGRDDVGRDPGNLETDERNAKEKGAKGRLVSWSGEGTSVSEGLSRIRTLDGNMIEAVSRARENKFSVSGFLPRRSLSISSCFSLSSPSNDALI